jgi:enoyl-CoA hydratase/carnithine racemase
MYRALHAAFRAAAEDDGVGAVLHVRTARVSVPVAISRSSPLPIAARGGSIDAHAAPAAQFMYFITRFKKPIVAAVDRVAIGFGTTILLHCDVVYVTPRTKLSCGFAALGLSPEAASSALLPAVVGPQRAFAMFAIGTSVMGVKAVDWGLALDCVDPSN